MMMRQYICLIETQKVHLSSAIYLDQRVFKLIWLRLLHTTTIKND
jgi:hypothetical protein